MATKKKNPGSATSENIDPSSIKVNAGLLDKINFAEMLDGATNIVGKAASELEKNIRQGLDAAQRIEYKYTPIGQIKKDNPQELLVRFREDAVKIVHLLMDFIELTAHSVTNLSSRFLRVDPVPPSGETSVENSTVQAPVVRASGTVKPGGTVTTPLLLENGHQQDTMEIRFITAGLLGTDGNIIEPVCISFSPLVLQIPPSTRGSVDIIVNVPDSTKPGVYSGLLQAASLSAVKAMLTVEVVP